MRIRAGYELQSMWQILGQCKSQNYSLLVICSFYAVFL